MNKQNLRTGNENWLENERKKNRTPSQTDPLVISIGASIDVLKTDTQVNCDNNISVSLGQVRSG